MATDQGKTSNVNGLAIMAELIGPDDRRDRHHDLPPALRPGGDRRVRRPSSRQGFPARPAYRRRTTGRRSRARSSSKPACGCARSISRGRARATGSRRVDREVKTVRAAVGVCDVSTLGKIDVQGADAAAFLDRVYINTFSTLPVGKARYGVMLREDGFVMDDGTTSRLGARALSS